MVRFSKFTPNKKMYECLKGFSWINFVHNTKYHEVTNVNEPISIWKWNQNVRGQKKNQSKDEKCDLI